MFFQCKWESVAKLHRLIFTVSLLLIALPSPAAVITEISPSAAPQGSTVSIVITGSGFVPGATRLRVSGTGIVVSSVSIPSPDTITATLVLSASPSTRNISVEGPDGNSNTVAFVIQPTRRTTATSFEVTHLAGGPAGPGVNDGVGTNARFYAPTGLWGVGGVLYVAEIGSISQNAFIDGSRRLRKVVAATGEVSTVATLDRCPISSGGTLFTNVSLWADETHAYIGDRCLHSVYKVDLRNGQISPLAQLRSPNILWGDDTDVYVLDNSLYRVNKQTGATQAVFSEFTGIIDGDGTFLYRVTQETATRQDILQTIRIPTGEVTTVGTYVLGQFRGASSVRRRGEVSGDFLYFIGGDSTIKRIDLATGDLTIFAGGIGSGSNTKVGTTLELWKDGPGNLAEFYQPSAAWADGDYLYVVEPNNHTLRRIRFSSAEVSTLAGLPALCCYLDGPATQARLMVQNGWGDGNYLYMTDSAWNVIRRVRVTDGETSTLAGNPIWPQVFNMPSIDGVGAGARFSQPLGIWGDGENLYVTERTGRVVRKIVIATGEVTTLAGKANTSGSQDGVGSAARFAFPGAIWGDGTFLYVSDNGMIRTVNIATGEVRTMTLSSQVAAAALWGDGANLYVGDETNNTVKKIVTATGVVTTIAQGFSRPTGIWGDGTVLYVTDRDATVRAIRLDTGAIATVAGTSGVAGSDDGALGKGHFLAPIGIWGDGVDLYVIDGSSIRKLSITPTADQPVITGITPSSIAAGTTATFTLTGSNFTSLNTTVVPRGGGIRVLSVVVKSPTALEARISTAPGVAPGSRTLRVIAGDAISNPVGLTIGTPIDHTTQSFSVLGRGVASAASSDQPGAPIAGYAKIETDPGAPSPAGLAIYRNRIAGILVSEAAVPSRGLIQAGRIHFFGRGGVVSTGIAMVNPTDLPVRVTCYFTRADGASLNQTSFDISPRSQIARFVDETPFNQVLSGSAEGTFSFAASSPLAVVALRGFVNERFEFLMTPLPVVDLNEPSDQPVFFPHLADGGGWTSQIVLINATDLPISGSLQFVSPSGSPQTITLDGQTATQFAYSIPGRASKRLQTSGLSTEARVGSIRLVAESGSGYPRGLVVFSYKTSGVVVTEAGVPGIQASSAFRLFVENAGRSGEVGSLRTGVAIANPGTVAADVRLELTDSTGNAVGPVAMLSLNPNGQVSLFTDQIAGFENLPVPFQGVLRVTTTAASGISVVGLRGRYNERREFLIATADPVDELGGIGNESYFPHFAQSGGYTTQFVIFPRNANATSGVLRFFSAAGQPMDLSVH